MNTSKKTRYYSALCVLVVFCMLSFTNAAEKTTDDVKEMKAKVISVRGIAKKMLATQAKSPWTPLKADDTLGQNSIIRTGLNSQVVLHFADRGQVTVDGGTKVGISQFASIQGADGTIKANLGLKYGSMRLKVDRSRGASDFSVSTAVATLSVRGTDGWMAFFGDLGLALRGAEGTWAVARGVRTRFVRGTQRTNGALARSPNIKNEERDTQVGDTSGGLTDAEKENLALYSSSGRVDGYVGNPTATGTTTETTDPENHQPIPTP
jgi:hypothetical protein